MSTTTLFVEILVIGLEALVWMALLADTGWDLGRHLGTLQDYKAYAGLVTTVLLAGAYVLGIFIDRAADSIYKSFGYSRSDVLPSSVGIMRLRIMKESEGIAKFLDYQRSRLRIARATVLNLGLVLVAGAIWTVANLKTPDRGIGPLAAVLLLGIGLLALFLAVIATRRIHKAFTSRLVEAYEIVTGQPEQAQGSAPIVAAVCYRRKQRNIEFLLVRTKAGKRWTFPKGHVEAKSAELPWQAARREAGEEAGASGLIEKQPFTQYRYAKGAQSPGAVVNAYLMKVEAESEPRNPRRQPQWFTSEAADKQLVINREAKSAHEHQRVIREALDRLTPTSA